MVSQRANSSFAVFWAVVISMSIAMVLTLVQVPQWLHDFWPDWIALIVMYWALITPRYFGPIAGFIAGLILEVLIATNFGVYGFGYALLALLVNITHLQFKVTSRWQQMALVALLISLFKIITGWLSGLVSDFTFTGAFWWSIVGNVVVWPFISILLDELRHIFRIR